MNIKLVSRFWAKLKNRNRKQKRVLMFGLDAAGKTTILYQLKYGKFMTTVPTISFNVEVIKFDKRKTKLTIWDINRKCSLSNIWHSYFECADGIIFVIDSSNLNRILENAKELRAILMDPRAQNATILVLANKQDLPNATNIEFLKTLLQLEQFWNKKWCLHSCSAICTETISRGFDWLIDNMP